MVWYTFVLEPKLVAAPRILYCYIPPLEFGLRYEKTHPFSERATIVETRPHNTVCQTHH